MTAAAVPAEAGEAAAWSGRRSPLRTRERGSVADDRCTDSGGDVRAAAAAAARNSSALVAPVGDPEGTVSGTGMALSTSRYVKPWYCDDLQC